MRFVLPHDESEFEIADAWWEASGAPGFVPLEPAYTVTEGVNKGFEEFTSDSGVTIRSMHCPTQLVALLYVAPPMREAGPPRFNETRMIQVLQAMCTGILQPPIEVWRGAPGEARLVPRDGFHRFYASVALGFPMLPVAVFKYVP
jgi:hypothetical protein